MKFIEAFMDKEASNGREWTDGHHVYRRVCDTMECRLISETDGWKIVDSQVCTMHHDVEWADTLKTRDALWQLMMGKELIGARGFRVRLVGESLEIRGRFDGEWADGSDFNFFSMGPYGVSRL